MFPRPFLARLAPIRLFLVVTLLVLAGAAAPARE